MKQINLKTVSLSWLTLAALTGFSCGASAAIGGVSADLTLVPRGGVSADLPHVPPISGYAEDVYQQYANDAGPNITIEVRNMRTGKVSEFAHKSMQSLVPAPIYRVMPRQWMPDGQRASFVVPQNQEFGHHDFAYNVDGFERLGYRLSDGTYRRLQVTVNIDGGRPETHQAVEFCWVKQKHCAILDPVIPFLQSQVDNRLRRALAGPDLSISNLSPDSDGAALQSQLTAPSALETDAAAAVKKCGLASHTNWSGLNWSTSEYSAWAKNIFGFTLWTMNIAKQSGAITCNASCLATPSVNSQPSSGNATPPYSVSCANKGVTSGTPYTGIGVSDAETKCSVGVLVSSASVGVSGKGAEIKLDFKMSGSVATYSGGMRVVDSCSYY